jgi:hypothetical protein
MKKMKFEFKVNLLKKKNTQFAKKEKKIIC